MARYVTTVGYEYVTTQYGTLTAATVSTVTLDGDYGQVEIVNLGDGVGGAVADIFVTVDGDDPAVMGEDSKVVPAPAGSSIQLPSKAGETTVVRLISAGAPRFGVSGLRG